jgi:uncharacterized protein (TIGR02594 family)
MKLPDTSARLYAHALRDNGIKEIKGLGTHLRIKAAIIAAATWLNTDDSQTAWCGCIRGLWGIETGTGVPPEHYRARSWRKWGRAVLWENAKEGDTVVMKRPGGEHVALYVRHNATHVWLYGGNQADACNVTRFKRELVTDIRRG